MCTDKNSDTGGFSKKDIVYVLMQKYYILKSDMVMQASSFKNHVRNSQIIAGGALSITLAMFTSSNTPFALSEQTKFFWVPLAFLFTTVAYYFVYDTLESSFSVQSLAERIVSIENRINEIVGTPLLIWESVIAKQLWTPLIPLKGVLHPIVIMTAYEMLLIFLLATGSPLFIYYMAWNLPNNGCLFQAILILLGLYSIVSAVLAIYVWIGTNKKLRRELRTVIDGAWMKDHEKGALSVSDY